MGRVFIVKDRGEVVFDSFELDEWSYMILRDIYVLSVYYGYGIVSDLNV